MSPAEYSMVLPPGQKPSPRPFSDFHSLKYDIVSLVAYLIGVEKRHFENEHEPPKLDIYEQLEKDKNARIIRKDALLGRGIHYCYMDDFYTGTSYAIKTIALQTYIQNIFDGVIQFNLESLLDEAIRSTWVQMSSKERKAFYDRYLRKIHPDISPSGDLRLVLG